MGNKRRRVKHDKKNRQFFREIVDEDGEGEDLNFGIGSMAPFLYGKYIFRFEMHAQSKQ